MALETPVLKAGGSGASAEDAPGDEAALLLPVFERLLLAPAAGQGEDDRLPAALTALCAAFALESAAVLGPTGTGGTRPVMATALPAGAGRPAMQIPTMLGEQEWCLAAWLSPSAAWPESRHVLLARAAEPLCAAARAARQRRDEKELQRQLIEAQKMQAVGTLTSGIAHDFNNLLTTVLGQVELLRLRHGRALPDDALDRLGRVDKAGRRAAGLVSQLLAFSRHDPQQMGSVDAWAAVLATVELLKHGMPESVEVRRQSSLPNGAAVWGNLGQLQQVLVSMANNSLTAMPNGGVFTLALDASPAPRAAADSPEATADWVVLSVSDTGCGMDEEARERAFEPFFTTKSSTDSAGLGLAIVYGIIQAHKGHIEVESTPGKGTTFRIFLPLQRAAAAARAAEAAPVAAPAGGEKVLLVEDDQAVAETTSAMLSSLGYQVSTALRPSEALRLMRSGEHQFDLMVTDVTMPEMTGYELADRIREEFGPSRVLFVTGYDFNSARGSTSRFLLQKPLSLQALGEGVRQVLATSAA